MEPKTGNRINLKNSVIVFNDDVQLSVTYGVEIEPGSGLLFANYLYSGDFHSGDELVHLLEIEAIGKAKMLALLKTQHNVSESLLPMDALLLELIYLSFGNWRQLHTWLWNNCVPFSMWY